MFVPVTSDYLINAYFFARVSDNAGRESRVWVWGLGFGVWGMGYGVLGMEYGAWCMVKFRV